MYPTPSDHEAKLRRCLRPLRFHAGGGPVSYTDPPHRVDFFARNIGCVRLLITKSMRRRLGRVLDDAAGSRKGLTGEGSCGAARGDVAKGLGPPCYPRVRGHEGMPECDPRCRPGTA